MKTLGVIAFMTLCALVATGPSFAGNTSLMFDPSDIVFHFHGTDTATYLGTNLSSVGDVNGDGIDDIAVSSHSPRGTYIFYGGAPVDSIPDYFLRGEHGPASAIDVTADGIADLITAEVHAAAILRDTGRVLYYQGYVDSLAVVPFDSIYPLQDNSGFASWFVAAFVDDDNLGDLVTIKSVRSGGEVIQFFSGAPLLDTLADWSYTIPDAQITQQAFGLIDFDGDHQLDIVVGRSGHFSEQSVVEFFAGLPFTAKPTAVIGRPEELAYIDDRLFSQDLANVGDFDGDGWDDLGVIYGDRGLVYRCGPAFDTIYDFNLGYTCSNMESAGDVNDDGYTDIVAGGYGTADGSVQIYLGGPLADTVPDLNILRTDLPPLFIDRVGWRVAGAGDFTGDGVDDFVFSCQNFAYGDPGDVFVVQGSERIVTEVADDRTTSLPSSIELYSIYPNPFNQTATIEFALDVKTTLSLEVLNSLGQRVAVVIDSEELSPGLHAYHWNGRSAQGKAVASGLYLCRLRANGKVWLRKIMLLK